MISVEEARKILAEEADHLTDKELEAIIIYQTALAERIIRSAYLLLPKALKIIIN